jgi:hypothetical protein
VSLPVGFEDSFARVEESAAALHADLQSLTDLLAHDGEVPEGANVFLQRKKGLVGHLREDLRELPGRVEGHR